MGVVNKNFTRENKKNRKIRQKSLRATMADIKEIESEQPDDVKEKEETKEPEEEVVDSNGKLSSKSSDISIEEIGAEESTAEKNENAEVLIQEPAPVVAVEEQTLDDEDEDEDEDDFEDETLIERLVGLTEMFPEGLTSTVTASAKGLVSGVHWAYGAGRTLTWVLCSSATIMFLPIMIESERLGLEEAQKNQQRQMLLGPGAAMSGGNAQTNAPLPQI